jgi:aspartyl-tRNA(Asn)/glutamyl-tRNA(Gln) amidotransferase subunit A
MHPDRWRDEASRPIAAAAERGSGLTAVEYVRALDKLAELRGMVADSWGDVDAFLCPSAASPAWPLGEEFPANIGGRPGHPMAQNVFATWVNTVGHPGLSIPVRPHADGRPLGVQVVGRFGGDDVVLEVARRLERVAPWTRPPFPFW